VLKLPKYNAGILNEHKSRLFSFSIRMSGLLEMAVFGAKDGVATA